MEYEASDERPKRKKLTEIPSTSNKDAMPILPEELIEAILVRVPVKYLLQFKCVSTDWFDRLVIWNPSIREFTEVFDFGPPQCWCSCGFGYDEVHDDYKVVGIFSSMKKTNFQAMIYSLKNDSLKTLEGFKTGVSYRGKAKFVNRKLHWITECRRGWGITSIDLVDEKWRKVEQPCYGVDDFILTLGVLGSDFYVLCSPKERTDVWVMKEYGVKESWTKLYTIKCFRHELSPPLFMSTEGEILHVVEANLTIYNPKNDSMRYPEVTNTYGNLEAELYIESLVSPVLENEPMTQC